MAMTLVALKAEITGDPTVLGLTSPYNAGAFGAVRDLLNAPRAGVNIDRDTIPSWTFFDACVPSEIAALSATNRQILQIILAMPLINVKSANLRAAVTTIFPAGATRPALAALQQRIGSRAEFLWGVGTVVTVEDIAGAKGA